MIEMAWAGMVLITVAWGIQGNSLSKGKKQLLPSFAALQAIGILLLVISDYLTNSSLSILGMLNVVSFLGAVITAALILKK